MTKWQYMREGYPRDGIDLLMRDRGEQGWELCGVYQDQGTIWTIYKRSLPSPAQEQ